ncbi:MAG: GNAT family N-acetyltransferase [Clostridia bacterium]
MEHSILSVREHPQHAKRAIAWFASKFDIPLKEYEKSMEACMHTTGNLPRWYLLLDAEDEIMGGCGLIRNDFVDRTDLFPYVCALYVETKARGVGLGGRLLEHVRSEGATLGFEKLYLCTGHTGYYEKYGWKHIAMGVHPSGETSRIYEAPVIRKPSSR